MLGEWAVPYSPNIISDSWVKSQHSNQFQLKRPCPLLNPRIGEKFITWTDVTPPVTTILADVSLYWLTRTFATSIYHYHTSWQLSYESELIPKGPTHVPVGYSLFHKELRPYPIALVKKRGNIVFGRRHDKVGVHSPERKLETGLTMQGGHFAALEVPELLWGDVEEFLKLAWKP